MAHKERHRHGSEHTKPSKRYSVLESVDILQSDKEIKLANDREIGSQKPPDIDHRCSSAVSSGKRARNTKNMQRGKTNKPVSDYNFSSERVDDATSCSVNPEEIQSEVNADLIISTSDSVRDVGKSVHDKPSISGNGLHGASSEETAMERAASIHENFVKILTSFSLFIWKIVHEWLEQQKPRAISLTTAIRGAYDRISACFNHFYPILWRFSSRLMKFVILLLMILLDCNIRGFDSLLRMGTTSFFTVIWCCSFSLAAMVGITKILIILVFTTVVAVLLGFVLALLMSIILSTIILFLYGSFWTTGSVVVLGGILFALKHERLALLVTTSYSMYCAKSYVGWLGLILGINLSFFSSDILISVLKNSLDEQATNSPPEHAWQNPDPTGQSSSTRASDPDFRSKSSRTANPGPSDPLTGEAEMELTSEGEISRLLGCNDHYSALGLTRYENIDISTLKREYKKKAMLVHPDKNMGTEKAAEAFKKLQNAYEVLLDTFKRKAYDDELRRDELLNYIRSFQSSSRRKNGRNNFFAPRSANFVPENEVVQGETRRIACKKCNNFHAWILTNRSKSKARWCQECQDFHQAKDGDGWVEQSVKPLMFGLLQKMEAPHAYICAESKIYNATEWFTCQGMSCSSNTHKPSFHVNTSAMSKCNPGSSRKSGRGGVGEMPDATDMEQEFHEWLQNAMQSGLFQAETSNESESPNTGSSSKSGLKKKKKGKKQW